MNFDGLKQFILALVRAETTRIDFLAYYPAVVKAQNSDLSLELEPDDKRIPAMSKVPIRFGIPAVTCKVNAGSRVLMGFAGGDPSKPVATTWEGSTIMEFKQVVNGEIKLESSSVKLTATGAQPVGRQGDMVMVGGPTVMIAFGTPLPPPGPPVPLVINTGVPVPFYFVDPVNGGIPSPFLFGQVTSGNPNVKG